MLNWKSAMAATVAAACLAMPATAQNAQGGMSMQGQQTEQSFSDAKIEAFVAAAASVTPIIAKAQKQMAGTEDQAERRKVMETMRGEMETAVADAPNISMKEYMAITQKARQDPAFRAKVQEMLRAEIDGGEGASQGS
ncbi:uncharacterized protein DUF4168 [Rhodothalassium salexigens DSM 2132]|uniref:Uncharacterized protein DUF4168 n=1 Tax=Rhodothalassium salexigens DSM 2132 TaxID=1188247 RepID=A0A4R2PSN0_RHOSA|nr:DUF4168 domain-containing protein [Rhodothalassium salexigens]MBB4210475.1 hypothetical protein [Rhodothalassium salexigens DSM 2132]MBK1639456.1 hypothetical protein [Rhodothalassium salexigens DSM 2132]TCP37968.1 uncharacterized protein DUF4168 [Rhodothalassium salexigens DSM 2132]